MFKRLLISMIAVSFLLSGCDFRPEHKVIEYQEEVKLSDGSFIWVDIKRHYGWSGWAPGGGSGAYMPGIVEISWDTGFPNVGRQSVFFDENLSFIDKIDGIWYVVGQKYPYAGSQEGIKALNCQDVGVLINAEYNCIFRINQQNEIVKTPIKAKQMANIPMNILYTVGIKNWGLFPEPLNKTKLSWLNKLELQKTQSKERQLINRPYSYDFINSSNGGEL